MRLTDDDEMTFNQVVSGSSPEWLRQRKSLETSTFQGFLLFGKSVNFVGFCRFLSIFECRHVGRQSLILSHS